MGQTTPSFNKLHSFSLFGANLHSERRRALYILHKGKTEEQMFNLEIASMTNARCSGRARSGAAL